MSWRWLPSAVRRTGAGEGEGEGRTVGRTKKVILALLALAVVAGCAIFISGVLPYKVYVLHTGSMSPTIAPKSAVLIHEHQFHVGQVVTFTEDGQTVTHRLVSINKAGLITTKGDANATADPWHVPKSQIIGGVVATVPEVGYWLVYLKSPLGAASVLLAAFAVWQIWSLGKAAAPAPETVPAPVRRGRHVRVDPRRIPDPIGRHIRVDPQPKIEPIGRHVRAGVRRPTLGSGGRHVRSAF
jgi:signal peptidase